MEDIAIIGLSFKLPQGAEDESSLWSVLQERRNLRTEWPKSRLNIDSFYDTGSDRANNLYSRGGHFLKEDPSGFDAPFFSITKREAAAMDPQQRMILETSYHAFENAGIPVEDLKGTRTAVFATSMSDDYLRMLARDPDCYPRTAITGNSLSITPNRVSWYFDLLGPSVHVDTACSSSMVAVDLAYQSLRNGDATMVCFDHRANGYGRGEGTIAIVLKRVSDAVKDGDMIRAVIRSSGTNQDGHTLSLPVPNPDSQERLIRHVYEKANLSPRDTRYVEAHGTGTPVGDPIEMKAIGSVFRSSRSREDPLYVGSIKANIGHLGASSGLAGIVKSVMILEKGIIPPNALFEKINPNIDVVHYKVKIPIKCTTWPSEGLRRVSVCSFGFGGTNAHIILDDAFHYLRSRGLTGHHCTVAVPLITAAVVSNGVEGKAVERDSQPSFSLRLLVWTAADEESLRSMTENYQQFFIPKIKGSMGKYDRLAFTLATHRTRMLWRAFALINMNDQDQALTISNPIRASSETGLALVFTGQGAQYVDMGLELLQYSVYKQTLLEVDSIYASLGCKWSLFYELRNAQHIDQPEYSQPLCTALQIALLDLMKSFNIVPDVVIGHSSGEIAAAYAIGALNKMSACKIAYHRGQLARKLMVLGPYPSAMMSVNLSGDQVEYYLKKVNPSYLSKSIHVACINSPLNCTLSGAEDAIDDVQRHLHRDKIFAQKLKTGVAYHSPLMTTVAAEYHSLLGTLNEVDLGDNRPPVLMISSVTGHTVAPKLLSTAQYWVDNLTSPVRFSAAIKEALRLASELKASLKPILNFVEIGPHCALRRPIQDTLNCIDGRKGKIRYASVLYKSKSCLTSVAGLAGQLFCHGYPVSITAVNQQLCNRQDMPFLTDCPGYPFNHKHKYWWESRLSRDFRLRESPPTDILGSRSIDWNPLQPTWRNFLSFKTMPWIADHVVTDTTVFPAAGMLVMALEALEQICPKRRKIVGYYIKEASFLKALVVGATSNNNVETVLQLRPLRATFDKEWIWSEVTIFAYSKAEWSECFRARIKTQYEYTVSQVDGGMEDRLATEQVAHDYGFAMKSCAKHIDKRAFYMHCRRNGIEYGDWFQLLDDIAWNGHETVVARLDVASSKFSTTGVVHPAVLDAAIHSILVQPSAGLSQSTPMFVPHKLYDAWFSSTGWKYPETSSLRSMATVTSTNSNRNLEGTTSIIACDGSPLCTMKKIVLAPVSRNDSKNAAGTRLLYGIEWKPQLSLLDSSQLQVTCNLDNFRNPEADIAMFHEFESTLSTVVLHTARWLRGVDRRRIPSSYNGYVRWMEEYAGLANCDMQGDGNDEELEMRLRYIEDQQPSWRIFSVIARNLKSIILGQVDPLQLAFDSGLAETFYEEIFDTVCDSRFQKFLELACHENPNIRIFEIGAGTGTMTRRIFSALQDLEKNKGNQFAEYVYTDISASFLEKARKQFHDERMTFRTFNAERDAAEQGFKKGTYDLVVAGSVLHATAELAKALQNVKGLLRPGGRLICVEVTRPERVSVNFAFGTLPGWWPKDPWRSSCPAITERQWDQVLSSNGFSGNDLLIKDYEIDTCHYFSLIVSTAETPLFSNPPSREVLLVVDGSSDLQKRLADLISKRLLESPCTAVETLSWNQIQATDLDDNAITVSLIEAEKSPLATISHTTFETLKDMMKKVRNLLWVSSVSIDDKSYPYYNLSQGFLRTIRSEATEKHIVSLAFESANISPISYAETVLKIFQASFVSTSPELEYIVRDGSITTGRLFEETSLNDTVKSIVWPRLSNECWLPGPALKLTQQTSGMLDTLEFVEDVTPQLEMAPEEVEIEAKAWGLFFRDVYVALGRLEGNDFGFDCAGVVTRVGASCSTVSPGDRVCMSYHGCMRTYPRASATNVVRIPDTLSFEAATSILSPGITAYRCLYDVARLRRGEKILIHSASGSTGQMAIWVAKLIGAEIFATVGLDEKKQFLIDGFDIPADHIFYSRDTTFARGVSRMTHGRGVDVVLNSLAGDGLKASWDCIAPCGRFIEIGKADITANSLLPMSNFAKNVSFIAVDLHHLSLFNPEIVGRLISETMRLAVEGMIQYPKPLHVFSVSNIEQAFRYLQSGRNTGRTVIRLDHSDLVPRRIRYCPTWRFDEDASYLIAGGLGGLGRLIIRWMADKGAKHLILPSRSGVSSQSASEAVSELAERGVNVVAPKCDVTLAASVAAMLRDCADGKMPPIKGCINAAMDLQDVIFENMTHEQWERTVSSKAHSSWNLHELLPRSLDFFVLLSSLAGIYGSAVQSNYNAGCTFQDALARYRTTHGKKAVSLDIGWMFNSGIIAVTERYQQVRRQVGDMGQIQDAELLALLEIYCDPTLPLLSPSKSQLLVGCITPADMLTQGKQLSERMNRPMYMAFSRARGRLTSRDGGRVIKDNAALYKEAVGQEERWNVVARAIVTKLAEALSIDPDDINVDRSLSDYGVDSLMAVELRNWIRNDFEAKLAVFDIMGGARIAAIGDLIVERSAVGKDIPPDNDSDVDEA
ncbi:hypothetical protein F5Y13DRAFT_201943 [Hypoxylon sp. FL1857]|nr:hypothetical protein F5Y13DRAFT_201943 [Hypoxylon sp. FL1857]